MLSLSQCFDFTDLMPEEIVLGVSLAHRHHALLSSYQLDIDRGVIAIRDRIVADLRCFIDLGAKHRAADLLLVLRMFLSQHLEIICIIAQEPEPSRSPFGSHDMDIELSAKLSSASTGVTIASVKGLSPTADAVILPFGRTVANQN